MPNQPRADNPGRRFRCYDEYWNLFQEACAANGTTPSRELQGFVKAYGRKHLRAVNRREREAS